MRAVEHGRRSKNQKERRAKTARRSSRFIYPKTAARRLHQSRSVAKNQNPQNGHLMARFDWGFGAICFGASPVAAVFGSAPGSATPPEHRIYSNPTLQADPSKQDISTLLGIGHFYFALTRLVFPPGYRDETRRRDLEQLEVVPVKWLRDSGGPLYDGKRFSEYLPAEDFVGRPGSSFRTDDLAAEISEV